MYTALPMTINKKQFVKLTREETLNFFSTLASQFDKLISIRDRVKTKTIEVEEIIYQLKTINIKKTTSLTKVLIENLMIISDKELLFGEHPLGSFLEENVFYRFPILKTRSQN